MMAKNIRKDDIEFGERRNTVFNRKKFDAKKQPIFLGEPVNIARYDEQKYPFMEAMINKQLSFFWRPEEVPLDRDKIDYAKLTQAEKRVFTANLKYQILLDSIQGRSPNLAFLPISSLPEWETWIETWSFSETIHSRSYTHILRNIVADPSEFFDNIIDEKEIADRANDLVTHYDALIEYVGYYNLFGWGKFKIKNDGGEEIEVDINIEEMYKLIYLSLVGVYILETVRFYVSFACSFSFAERKLMEGNAKIIKLISRDEALHGSVIQSVVQNIFSGLEGDLFKKIAQQCEQEVAQMFKDAATQEKAWAKYLFLEGNLIGLNERVLGNYVDFLANDRYYSLFGKKLFDNPIKVDPLPWMEHWLDGSKVQVANQEVESSNYVIGSVDNHITEEYEDKIKNIKL